MHSVMTSHPVDMESEKCILQPHVPSLEMTYNLQLIVLFVFYKASIHDPYTSHTRLPCLDNI